MKALVFEGEKFGLVYKPVDDLKKIKDELIVKVLSSSINRRDFYITKGLYPGIKTPVILGSDAVVEYDDKRYLINPNHNWGLKENIQSNEYSILGMPKNGTFSEFISVPKDRLVLCPKHLSNAEAAALPLSGLTAYRALFSKGKLREADSVFISGFGGGVASIAFLMAKSISNSVYVSSSSEKKRNIALKEGAKAAFDYNEFGYGKSIYKKHGGIDLVIDSAGGKGFNELVAMCNPGARISVYGGSLGKISFSPQVLFWKQLTIFGTTMGSDSDFKQMINLVATHKIKPIISHIIPLSQGQKAFDLLEEGGQMGKIVLDNTC